MASRELIASTLQLARYALAQSACFGEVFEIHLRHPQRPNGIPARLRIAVEPDSVVCRVHNTSKEHGIFDEAAKSLFVFLDTQMRNWQARRGSDTSVGTGGYKVFWQQATYYPPKLDPTNILFADLLQAVREARNACLSRSRFQRKGAGQWQSAETNNGVYPVGWTVRGKDGVITIQLKNKGWNERAFLRLASKVFNYIQAHNRDARRLSAGRVGFGGVTHVLQLEVPSRPTI